MIKAILLLLLFSGTAFADEVSLGRLSPTVNQVNRLPSLHSSVVRGFSTQDGDVTVYTTRAITTSEKNTLIADIQALPDTTFGVKKDNEEFTTHPFKSITPDQAEAYIDANVTDLASAKVVMKRMVRVLIYLVRRTDLAS